MRKIDLRSYFESALDLILTKKELLFFQRIFQRASNAHGREIKRENR